MFGHAMIDSANQLNFGRLEVVFQRTFQIESSGNGHVQDITSSVASIVTAADAQTGIAHVFNVGSTASVATIEFEPGLERDLPELLNRLIPPSREYGHEKAWHDGNGHSHLQASWLGPEVTIPITDGKLALGRWQQVVHVECDVRPRSRRVVVTVVGD